QDCFETTNWNIFKHQDLEVYTSTVLCYIKHCVDTVTVDRRIRVYPNQKPWMTKEVKVLLKDRSAHLRSGDEAQYRTARANLRRAIREAKTAYKRRIEDQFSSNNIQQVWQGVQHITNYRSSNLTAADGDDSLAEGLNCFFTRFEVDTHQSSNEKKIQRKNFKSICGKKTTQQ